MISLDDYLSPVRIISEYETFKSTALSVPSESSEMMDLIDYMETARTGLVVQLADSVKVGAYACMHTCLRINIIHNIANMYIQ